MSQEFTFIYEIVFDFSKIPMSSCFQIEKPHLYQGEVKGAYCSAIYTISKSKLVVLK